MDFGDKKIWIAATFDTKSDEAFYILDVFKQLKMPVMMVDLSTEQRDAVKVNVTSSQVAHYHPAGTSAVFTGDRGSAIQAMSEAFKRFVLERNDIGAMIGIGGSGGTSLVTPAMQALPIGVPKLMLSTMLASSEYVGASDIAMMYSVTDIAGLNRISRRILANAAGAIAGSFMQSLLISASQDTRRALGLSMFGVTTPCVSMIRQLLEKKFDCLVFHATGMGGQSMEKLLDSHLLAGMLDITTTEVADFLFGGVLPCTADRFGAVARTRRPYVGSCGALDMVNFGAIVPLHYKHRNLYVHNAQVTLMRTTAEENARMGEWIAHRLNACSGEVRWLIPEGGVSALDAPGQPFWDKDANAALFNALEAHFKPTASRHLIRTPYHINDPAFAKLAAAQFLDIVRETATI